MPSRHTTVEITSAEIKNISSALAQARDVMAEWQVSHDKWGLDWDGPDNQYKALAEVLGAIESVKAMEKQLWKQHGRKQPGEKSMAVEKVEKHQPTAAELREHGKAEPAWVQEASAFKRSGDFGEFSDGRRAQMETARGIKDSEHYHRTIGGSGEVAPSDSVALRHEYSQRRAAQEHAKPEAVREIERDDEMEIG